MKYYGIVKQRSMTKRVLLFCGCLFLIVLEFSQQNYLFTFVAALLAFLNFFRKYHEVSEEGIFIRYRWLGLKVDYTWTWDQITAMRPDYKKARPNVFMEMAKDVTIRAFVFTPEDARGVLELAKRMAPDAYIDDRTEEERIEYEEERDRIIEEQKKRIRRQKQEAKARAKKNKKKK